MPACPDLIKQLVDRFDHQLDQVRSADYNETQLRIDFVNPLFRQLGWDIDNTQGYAEQYREVVHEDRVLVAGANKAPDYSFRIGGVRKFFVETKKPFVNIKDNWEPAYQLRRYGWSAKLAVSILTDFEELAVYDCRITPKQLDKASTARRDFIAYRDYCDRWDFIEGTFSKQAVLRGDFDRYCQTKKGRGAQEFDDAFLEEIEEWRQKLASNLALRNDDLDEQALNFAVQRIIDRIIFLRICEDRGTEHTGQLQALLNGDEVYARLQKLFRDADARYNSGLFHFKKEPGRAEDPDELTPGLEVDDATLKGIVRRLYYPESPYEFTMVSADILGSVYERFLGKVITLTAGHRAKVEEKPEVRKAGGVYYTPAYIVDYIVKQTVGKLLADCTSPKDAAKLKILDPACGSGSFLLGAYQHLLDWHLQWYVKDGTEKWSKGKNGTIRPADRPSMAALIQTEEAGAIANPAAGHWALTIKERKRILLDNIHGVDIDYQAVEVTKLSLLLKVLEGETAESLGGLWTLFRERALPDLGRNIQCGNSLIGTEFTADDAWRQMAEEEQQRVNPFDYERAFSRILNSGGFDAVIGNPPYLNIDDVWGKNDPRLRAIKSGFPEVHTDKTDILFYFLARATSLSRSHMAFIVSRAFLEAYKAQKLRQFLTQRISVDHIIDFRNKHIFEGVGITTCIIVAHAAKQQSRRRPFTVFQLLDDDRQLTDLVAALADPGTFKTLPRQSTGPAGTPWVFVGRDVAAVSAKLDSAGQSLGNVLCVGQGMQTGRNDVFGGLTSREVKEWKLPRGTFFRRAVNSAIDRYVIRDTGEYILFPEGYSRFADLPAGAQRHLQAHASELKERAAYQRGDCE